MIKVVFFDMGGVTVTNVVNKISDHIRKLFNLEHFSFFSDDPHIYESFDQLEKGIIEEKTFWIRFAKRVNRPLPENAHHLFSKPLRYSHFSPIIKKIIRQLKQKGITVAVLSNVPKSMGNRHHRLGHYALFDHLILSYEVGYRKPHEQIYFHALETVNVKPEESLFIDDRLENVEKARELGMHAIHFKNPSRLQKELKKYSLI